MRIVATALLSVLVLAFAAQPAPTPVHAQSAPVQAGRTPSQSDQSREQDRRRAQHVRIGRDWKARGGANDRAGSAAVNKEHETIGRDWRAHPKNRDQ